MQTTQKIEGRRRVVIENVQPEVDGGRFPIKRVPGETVAVEADIFADGHEALAAAVLYRREGDSQWSTAPMHELNNDRWRAEFRVTGLGRYFYTVEGWVDHFATWRRDLLKRLEAGQEVRVDILGGADLIDQAAGRASGIDGERLHRWAGELRGLAGDAGVGATALDAELGNLASRYADRSLAVLYPKELAVTVDNPKARYSAWYEMFPRSCSLKAGMHGTFADCEARLPYIASLGFDVLYLPPIHPIGRRNRKGRNNATDAMPDDVGSPWAIGNSDGGHRSIAPELGGEEGFDSLLAAARTFGIDIALDLAFQCAPDHPWVAEHPEWFRRRADGSIQYAENPPKKYQDIYPLDFESQDWQALWQELRGVVQYWIDKGIRLFRVDNPHTKAFAFWEWLIADVQRVHPDALFLAEAFTRPKVMYRLAKIGFSQSYTYFTWRNTKQELASYVRELTQTPIREYMRPNLWPNTPDILPEYLQLGGRPAFQIRLGLAATLGASYGIYGPAYELCENTPRSSGSEEYLDSEKYELKHRDLNAPGSLKDYIARLNRVRRDNPALHTNDTLWFHEVGNPMLLCYSKTGAGRSNLILVVVSLDFSHTQGGWLDLNLDVLGLDVTHTYQAHDLLTGARYLWSGSRNYVECNPQVNPVLILALRRKVRTEKDFDYYL